MTGAWQDIKTTIRSIRKWPIPYGVIIVTLALGIGINTMFFTFFSGMVLRPLPFAAPAAHPDTARAMEAARPYDVFRTAVDLVPKFRSFT